MRGNVSRELCDAAFGARGVAFCEGAVDALALRALRPAFLAIGIPGIKNWRPEWAKLAQGKWRIALDRDKPDRNGIVQADESAARMALDLAGRGLERDGVLEWMVSRHRRGRTLFCVLCGASEPWLCRGCGRRRPRGKDWAEDWANQR